MPPYLLQPFHSCLQIVDLHLEHLDGLLVLSTCIARFDVQIARVEIGNARLHLRLVHVRGHTLATTMITLQKYSNPVRYSTVSTWSAVACLR